MGDIRHGFADIERARRVPGYRPAVTFEQGLRRLVTWLADQDALDQVEQARAELADRGLTV